MSSGIGEMFVRMITSLAIVLAIVAVAYAVMRRRAVGGGRTTAPARAGRPGRAAGRPRRAPRHGVEVIGRVGLTRSSAAVAVRFGDRVLLVGASDQAPISVLADIDAITWEAQQVDAEWTVPATIADDGTAVRPASFVEALREATIRRG